MSFIVWKYTWPLQPATAEKSFDMPVGAEVLYAREQGEALCIWARVNSGMPKEKRNFVLCGTGHDAPDFRNNRYVGSGHFFDGSLILHVFEVRRGLRQ